MRIRYYVNFSPHVGKEVSVKKSLMEAKVERCCIVGTLFKKMELKPSILKEISASVRRSLSCVPNSCRQSRLGQPIIYVCPNHFIGYTLKGLRMRLQFIPSLPPSSLPSPSTSLPHSLPPSLIPPHSLISCPPPPASPVTTAPTSQVDQHL